MRWKSDIPLTDGQLMSKRDEFWDTAPAFEGEHEFIIFIPKMTMNLAREDRDLGGSEGGGGRHVQG